MSFDEATIMAYVDGECDAVTVKRIEKAMAADPVLAKQVEQAQALRNRLSAHYDPIAEEAVPDRLTAMLTAAASSNIDSSFTARKADREMESGNDAEWVSPNGARWRLPWLWESSSVNSVSAATLALPLPRLTERLLPAAPSQMRWKHNSRLHKLTIAIIVSALPFAPRPVTSAAVSPVKRSPG